MRFEGSGVPQILLSWFIKDIKIRFIEFSNPNCQWFGCISSPPWSLSSSPSHYSSPQQLPFSKALHKYIIMLQTSPKSKQQTHAWPEKPNILASALRQMINWFPVKYRKKKKNQVHTNHDKINQINADKAPYENKYTR